MTSLPPLILRAPGILYGAAVIYFLLAIGVTLMEMNVTMGGDQSSSFAKMMMVRTLYQASLESLYIAANGVIAHILLAIWQDARIGRNGGGDS